MRRTWVCFFIPNNFGFLLFPLFTDHLESIDFIFSAGEHPLPPTRVEEVIFVLQELARLVINLDTASVLPSHPCLKGGLLEENLGTHAHLLFLLPSFCELVISRYASNVCLSQTSVNRTINVEALANCYFNYIPVCKLLQHYNLFYSCSNIYNVISILS